jgi:hypothetical protein
VTDQEFRLGGVRIPVIVPLSIEQETLATLKRIEELLKLVADNTREAGATPILPKKKRQ